MAAQWQHVSGANSINQLYPVMFQASYVPHSRAVAAVESHYATHTLNVHSTRFTGPCSMHTVRSTNCNLHSLHLLHLCTQQSHIADAYWSPCPLVNTRSLHTHAHLGKLFVLPCANALALITAQERTNRSSLHEQLPDELLGHLHISCLSRLDCNGPTAEHKL